MRPILIFLAAKENGFVCSGRCCKEDSPDCSNLSAGRFDSGGKGGC
ncbi:MAG: hypothetical protein PUK15_04110 [Bacteroidales bacterium]|nr:hypothetical protein [Bacteroidales bacterium]